MATTEIKCPKCGSTQITTNKKGFSGKKAVVGGVLTGGIGLLAGTLGSNNIIITCLACGHQFSPGEGNSEYMTIGHYQYSTSGLPAKELAINNIPVRTPAQDASDSLFYAGLVKDEKEDYSGAIEDFSKSIEINPKDSRSFYYRGLAKIKMGQKESGCLDFWKAIEIDEENGRTNTAAEEAIRKYGTIQEREWVNREGEEASGEQSFFGNMVFFLILSIIGLIISFNLFANSWNFLGIIFSIATLLCIGISILSAYKESKRIHSNEIKSIRIRNQKKHLTNY